MKRHAYTCNCSAYTFPHRMGSGKCVCHFSDRLCEGCGQPATEISVDYGIGAYEYWGDKGVHRDVQQVSDCCEATMVDNDAKIGRFFRELAKEA